MNVNFTSLRNGLLSTILAAGLIPASSFAGDKEVAAEGIRNFGFSTFRALYNAKGKEPLAISPMSISEAMTLATQGSEDETRTELEDLWLTAKARTAGATADTLANGIMEIRQSLLDHAAASHGTFEYTSANALWGNNNPEYKFEFAPDFLKVATKSYGAKLTEEDFADAQTLKNINDWVSKTTNGKITELLAKLDTDDVAVLLNAIYAKGKFLQHFPETVEANYTDAKGASQTATFLKNQSHIAFFEDKNIKAFSIPIGSNDAGAPASEITLDIFTAKTGNLKDLVGKLDGVSYTKAVAGMKPTDMKLLIVAGKVEQKEAISLKGIFSKNPFNLVRTFDKENAQFGLLGSTVAERNLYINDIATKTFYEVTPFGFEAAAATAVRFASAGAIGTPPPTHKLDSASVHIIRHIPTGTPLFISVYDSPQLYSEARIVELVEEGLKVGRYLRGHVKGGMITSYEDSKTGKTSIVLQDEKTYNVIKTYKVL